MRRRRRTILLIVFFLRCLLVFGLYACMLPEVCCLFIVCSGWLVYVFVWFAVCLFFAALFLNICFVFVHTLFIGQAL